MPEPAQLRLCRLDEIEPGRARGFDPLGSGRDTVFALRTADGPRVWADRCPHLGTPLPWRKDAYLNAAGSRVVCAAHGALFEPDSGLCVQGPCAGQHLLPVAFEVDAQGDLLVHHHNIPGDIP